MRSEIIDDSFGKVWSYAEEFNLSKSLKSKALQEVAFYTYRKTFPLLIWRNELKRAKMSKESFSYFEESVSDISTAFFLFIQGFYKPAFFILRSSIENFSKFFYFIDFDPHNSNRIDQILHEVKKKYFKIERTIHASFVCLGNSYSDLSLCVHGASEYMAMMQGLSDYPKFNAAQSTIFKQHIDRVCPSINFLTLYVCKEIYHKIHFKHRDIIISQVSRSHKKILFG